MNVKFVWMGNFANPMSDSGPGNVLTWTPDAIAKYLVIVQSTVSCEGGKDYSAGVTFDIVKSDGTSVLDGNNGTSAGAQTTYTKCSSGGPSSLPLACLTWQVADPVPTQVWVTLNPNDSRHNGGARLIGDTDNLSITVIEVDELPGV
jgi:hypothetical protein